MAGSEIWLGSAAWLESRGVNAGQTSRLSPSSSSRDRRDACPALGSVVHVAIDGKHRGTFVLGSGLRPQTEHLISELSARHELALLSGDNECERETFRALFGERARLRFNESPLGKLDFIRDLQQGRKTVMMVGDGLNDAGALQQSDVGVAVVEKVGAFSPASDVILEAGMVPQLPALLRFSRLCVGVVHTSFAISVVYNLVGISLAARGLFSPLISAILMPLSSITVVAFACSAATWAAKRVNLLGDGIAGRG